MKSNVIKVGCSSFSVGFWKGIFYPDSLPSREYLSFYAQYLPAVEINTTFYGTPTPKTLQKWFDSTPADFQFFIKMPKEITHTRRLENIGDLAENFCNHISGHLGRKLAGFLYQLPPSFHYSAENLKSVLAAVVPHYRNVVEFRHISWWTEEVLQTLEEHGIIFCGVSYPGNIPDEFIINNKEAAYYRMHGVPQLFKSRYDNLFLDKIATEAQNANREVFLFFNNTFGTSGIINAIEMMNLLGFPTEVLKDN
ncbi:DUF72 domain-containing protein [Chryseobacterium salipaludis]|uniref:DUF72 domain-containing protein n=1 Tax=Chryseobacterium TaxID=59732 RepID=UPI001FF279DD|nr:MULTISPECIES: DUF72 domain-containing protein [Chryseobacterium]MCJ8496646.1 DUF72 domain-containing protein [Chryseobacterium salipaludis]MCX3296127.1 DUF72 domain-containing protein [Planobacterium sp. JC490]